MYLTSGYGSSSSSGKVLVATSNAGTQGDSGRLSLKTGSTSTGDSGTVLIETGIASYGKGGNILLVKFIFHFIDEFQCTIFKNTYVIF